jgi:ribonuclease P protein component
MLAKQHRLSAKEMRHVLRHGAFLAHKHVCVRYLPADTQKYGVVVSKKGGITAVQRNSVRRKVYGLLKDIKHTHPVAHVAVLLRVKKEEECDVSQVSELLHKMSTGSGVKNTVH